MEIPTELVERYATVDPETEEILFSGADLRRDMIVVIEDVELRWDLVDEPDERQLYYTMVMNRWCRVSNLFHRNGKVEFLAEYEDGFQVKRVTPVEKAWIVKKDSIPPRTQAEWEAQLHTPGEVDQETAMKLTGHAPNPSTIVSFDTGETRQV